MPEPMVFTENKPLHILVSPLNWGLGHATRVIPLIRALQEQGHIVITGGNGASLLLLKKEFPETEQLFIPFPTIRYGRGARQTLLFIIHSFRLLMGIQREHQVFSRMMRRRHFDLVISDSRLGLYHRSCHSIIITHQLHMKFPKGWGLLQRLVNAVNRHYLRKFDEVWIPDSPGEINLSGELSHTGGQGMNIRYIGPLSRFQLPENKPTDEAYILVMLGGPEPQRSILEQILIRELSRAGREAIIAAGSPEGSGVSLPPTIRYISYAGTREMEQLIMRAGLIIGRSGYTTVMELVSMGKPAILIPTPGQPEQEYLAEWLQAKGYFLCFPQYGFSLEKALEAWAKFNPVYPALSFNNFPVEGLLLK